MTMPVSTIQENDAMVLGGGITLTETGAVIEGNPTVDDFCTAVQKCYRLANATMWAIGDLLLYGEGRSEWGETYTQAIELTQKSYSSLSQAVWVSKAYPPEGREFAGMLSWSHHRTVASIKDPAERRQLLQRCVDNSLSRDDLRAMMPKPSARALPLGEVLSNEITCPFCSKSFTS